MSMIYEKRCVITCADPESFVRGGPNLITFFFFFFFSCLGERGSEYHYKWAIISPPAKRHINGVSLAGRWWPNTECWLVSFVVLQGIRTNIAKKPYVFVIFQGGGGSGPPVPPLDSHMFITVFHLHLPLNNGFSHPWLHMLIIVFIVHIGWKKLFSAMGP